MKNLLGLKPLFFPLLYALIIVLLTAILQKFFGTYLKLFHSGAMPDYLGVCIALNFGLTFDYVQNALRTPLENKIKSMRDSAIAQLEDKKIDHSELEKDLDMIEKSNNDKSRDYSRIIRILSYIWGVFGIIALICEYWIQNFGLPNIIFLWPPIYFYICYTRHYLSISSQVTARLKCVDDLITAETMRKKALEAIQGSK